MTKLPIPKYVPLTIFDNNGETADRYTVIMPDGDCLGSSDNPFHPQGFGQHIGHLCEWPNHKQLDFYYQDSPYGKAWTGHAVRAAYTSLMKDYKHLGRMVSYYDVPKDVQLFIDDNMSYDVDADRLKAFEPMHEFLMAAAHHVPDTEEADEYPEATFMGAGEYMFTGTPYHTPQNFYTPNSKLLKAIKEVTGHYMEREERAYLDYHEGEGQDSLTEAEGNLGDHNKVDESFMYHHLLYLQSLLPAEEEE